MNLGRVSDAAAISRRVLELAVSQQDINTISAGLHVAASIAVMDGDLELGARLTGAAQSIVDETGAQPPPSLVNHVEALPALRQQLDAEHLERLLAEGSELSIDEAVALVLSG